MFDIECLLVTMLLVSVGTYLTLIGLIGRLVRETVDFEKMLF